MAIIVPIGVDTKGLQRGLTGARGQLARFGKIAAIAAGAAALGGLVKTIQIGTEEFMEQQRVAAQTSAVLKSTGGVAKVTADEISTLAESLMKKSGVDDEAIQSGQNLLLTFTKIRNETGKGNDIFNQATKATLDLSVAMGKDMQSSAILVGKALNDPIRGATALTRAGIQLTDSQKEQIKRFVESGRVLEAQKIILRELETQFGGSAEAAGKTLPGQLNILKQTFSNLAGELVARFMPTIATAATRLVGFISEFAKKPTLTAKVSFVVGTFGGAIWRSIQTVSDWWQSRKVVFEDNPANRLKVTITPPAKERIQAMFDNLVAQSNASAGRAGDRLGRALARGLVLGFNNGTEERKGVIHGRLLRIFFGVYQIQAGIELARRLWAGFTQEMKNLGASWPDIINSILGFYSPYGLGQKIGGLFKQGVEDGAQPRSGKLAKQLKMVLNAAVRDAVQSARRTLQSLGGEVLGFLSDIRSASIRSPGGKLPADILAEQRRLEDERLRLEEERLRAALESSEDKVQAQLDLDEFLLNKEITLRDRAIADQQATDKAAVDSLVDRFNQGLISADQFYADLQAIIGPAQGDALGAGMGSAFVNSFKLAVDEIKGVVADIFAVVGKQPGRIPIGPTGGTPVQDVQAEESYNAAVKDWEDRRKAFRKKQVEKAKAKDSPEGAKITEEEQKAIEKAMKNWEKRNKKPTRKAYGLALGGILKKTVFAAGEMGPEAVIPLDSQAAWNMLRDAATGSGGGGGQTVINLTVNAGLGTNPDELSRVIVDSIKRYERRNGQVFQTPLASVTSSAQGRLSTSSGATDFNRLVAARKG